MKLLILTQKVDQNDDVLGFFHRWLIEFASHCETVTVIGLEVHTYHLPGNVMVFSLGKEKGKGKLAVMLRFFYLVFKLHRSYDRVFVHMNPIYVALAGWWWKLSGKKIGLWYTHRNVDMKLRIAEKFADVVFTVAKESFRLPSKKRMVTGHGIDIGAFAISPRERGKMIQLLHVGRITPIKNCIVMVEACRILRDIHHKEANLTFIGATATESDKAYELTLKEKIREYKLESNVLFAGSVSNKNLPPWYGKADITLNQAPTGGIDKAVLESMAAGVPAIVANEAFRNYFGAWSDVLMSKDGDAEDLAQKIVSLFDSEQFNQVASDLREKAKQSDVSILIPKLISALI